MPAAPASPAAPKGEIGFELAQKDGTLRLWGEWTVWAIGALDAQVHSLTGQSGKTLRVDAENVTRMDTAGAMLFDQILDRLGAQDFELTAGKSDFIEPLLKQIRANSQKHEKQSSPPPQTAIEAQLEKLGRAALQARDETIETLAFLGEATVAFTRIFTRPHQFRWPAAVHVMEVAGLNALPILLVLSFFVGLVIAYMGVNLLRTFGAEVFTVELLAVSVLREFGVFITGILIAGRTNSAFAAELGAMKLNSEVDALKAMGLNPMDVLVTPRILAVLIMAPLMTFGAMMAGLAGGILVLWSSLDMSPSMTLGRIHEVIPLQHLWVGLSKAPVFGFVLSVIGCRQGLAVERDVQSLGSRTTAAVVHGIFLVVVIDAIFAIAYLQMNI